MAVLPSNILQQVQTYQKSGIAFLDNLFCGISISNKKFNNFQDLTGNLGTTVTFDLPVRYNTINSLVAQFQASQQRVQPLTVDQQFSTSYAFSAEQFIFNVEDYMEKFGKGAIKELGTQLESNLLLNFASAVPVYQGEVLTGALHTESGPYRFFSDGITPINSFGQLAKMLAYFRNYGSAGEVKSILSDIAIPDIANSGLNQFVMNRNEELALEWQLGRFSNCDWYQSNLLPIHNAGSVGNSSGSEQLMTVVSTNDPTGANITQITFSVTSGASDPNCIASGDLMQFIDGVSGQPNLRYLIFIGQKLSANPVQIRATASAASSAGSQVTVNIYPALCSQSGNQNQNIIYNIVAGMQVQVMPTHKCGIVYSGNALYLAMPQLPDQSPYATAYKADPDTGIALRYTHGSLFGQNQMGFINDAIMGSTLVPEYSMRILFPVTQ
jgi:hypothetical protein